MAINPGANLTAADRDATRKQISTLPGVKAVYPDMPHYQDLYTSTLLINAPAVWNVLGGRANAGAGVKFASMDGGVHHLSRPCSAAKATPTPTASAPTARA